MRGPARDDAAECACCEVVAGVQLDLLLGSQGTKLVGHCVVCADSIARGVVC